MIFAKLGELSNTEKYCHSIVSNIRLTKNLENSICIDYFLRGLFDRVLILKVPVTPEQNI